MDKKKNNKLLSIADSKLRASSIFNEGNIKDSYNSSIAAFSVSIAMSGLRPTLAIYYHKEDRKNILEIIAQMLLDEQNIYYTFLSDVCNKNTTIVVNNAETLLRYAFYCNDEEMKKLQKETIDCAIALKQVVRTYNLKKDEEN